MSDPIIVVMGVSGCGKTTIAKLLSEKTKIPFFDADDFHPKENVVKMSNGIPLKDEDRIPWLMALNAKMKEQLHNKGIVLACSALKERYREILNKGIYYVHWVYLEGDFETVKHRIEEREGHFMGVDLLQSQFDCLEEPAYGIKVDIKQTPDEVLDYIIKSTIEV